MDRLGFIHEKLDIKILILFVLRRLPSIVDAETLRGLVMCDDGISYFDYTDCLSELVTAGNVEELEGGYLVTANGSRSGETVENSLPYSVRKKAERLLSPVREKMRRDASILTHHRSDADGTTVTLSMGDGRGDLIRLSFVCAGDEQAKRIESNFRREAEEYYQKIVALLSE